MSGLRRRAPEDTRQDYGETRFKAFELVNGVLFTATYTMRGEVYRIISAQKIREKEMGRWL